MRVLVLTLVALAGCYSPQNFTECSLKCEATTNECPSDTTCAADGYCHKDTTTSCSTPTGPTFAGVSSATPVGETGVELTWVAATDPTTDSSAIVYRVYLSTTTGTALTKAPAFTSVGGATSTQVQGLTAKTTYYFVVRAVNAANIEDDNTHEISTTTLDTTPPTFAGVTTLTASGTTLSVGFAAATDNVDPAGSITYRVYIATAPGTEDFSTPALSETGVAGAIVTGLASAPAYYVVVRAVDTSGNEDKNTVEKSVKFGDTDPPSFGGAMSATGLVNAVQINYTQATDNVSPSSKIVYLVYQGSTSGGENFSTPVYTSAAGAEPVTVGGLAASTKYYFVVRAKDEAGNIDLNTKEVSATTQSTNDTTPPTFAGLTSATSSSASAIVLSWSAASDDVSAAGQITYSIFQSTTAGGETFTTPTYRTQAGATTYTVTGLNANQKYYFVVRAIDQAGNSDTNTTERSATTAVDNTPPTFAGATSATAVSSTSIKVSWTAASDDNTATADIVYLVYDAKDPAAISYTTAALTTVAGVTSAQINGLVPSSAYTFVVRARDQAGNVDSNTNQVHATTLADTVPPTFAGATGATAASNTSVTVTWNAGSDDITPTNMLVYDVYVSTTSGGEKLTGTPSATSAAGATSYTVTGLNAVTQYYFIVRARDQAGNRDSNTIEVSATTPLL